MRLARLIVAAALTVRCATAPTQTAGQAALARNARALVSGRLVDASGHSVANMRVDPIPMARDVLYPDPATTDADGHFELKLFAPASYIFLLCRGGLCVITADPRDPSRTSVTVEPGRRYDGIELRFLSELWSVIEQAD